jgi:coenzyme F420-0:L-glutamate ligase/coenzyme F420-1:gamma-L-glutamate ligase
VGVSIIPVAGIPEVKPGDDLAGFILDALEGNGLALEDGDVLVVTQKVVSKAEGRIVDLRTIEPSEFAQAYAALGEKDPRQIEVVLRESRRIVRSSPQVLICETRHGFICANAGVDASNSGGKDTVVLLPEDPDASAERIRVHVEGATGARIGIVISDTFGRPWREGPTDVAIGSSGIGPLHEYIGQVDPHGYELRITAIAVVDELASAAELALGKVSRVPVALIRGYAWERSEGKARDMIRDASKDLFR